MDELSHLNCPFTWKMKKLCHTPDSLLNKNKGNACDDNDEDHSGILLLELLHTVAKAYEYTESNLLEKAMKEIAESQDLFNDLQKEIPKGLSIEAVNHIVQASRCFILKRMNKTDDIKKILKTISLCKKDPELGTLHGCQSAIWHFYNYVGNEETLDHALTAIKLNPTNGLWHFLHAKSLRRIRRQNNHCAIPSRQEQLAFNTAFDASQDPFIGIYLAQMYREIHDYNKANAMYNTILDFQPNNCSIYLKLALGFIRCKEAAKARQCLDYVEARMPKNCRYLHYKGIYLDKCLKSYKEALECFETAGSLMNFTADLSYLSLKLRLTDGKYNSIPYLKNMLERYRESGGYQVQVILLNMGAHYSYAAFDVMNACKYYLQAIEIDPRRKLLRTFHSDVSMSKLNVFQALGTFIIPKLKRQENPDEETLRLIEKATKYYKLYGTDKRELLRQQMKAVTIGMPRKRLN